MDKNSLLASLTGEADFGGEKKQEQDLFGDVALDEDDNAPPPLAVPDPELQPTAGPPLQPPPPSNEAPAPAQASPPAGAPPQQPSLLAQSGLLGMASSDHSEGGGGLFDAVDEEEERKEAEERRRREEEEARRRKEEEERLRKQQEEEERRRKEEQLRQQQLQQQQQQKMEQQRQLQQQQQQQMQQQQQNLGGSYGHQSQYQQPQQQSAMMQSAMMQSSLISPQDQKQPYQHQQQNQQNLNSQMGNLTINAPALNNNSFYREHPPTVVGGGSIPSAVGGSPPPTNAYQGQMPGNNYYYGTQQQPQTQSPSIMAGMYNLAQNGPMGQVRKMTLTKPQDFSPLYTRIVVGEPMLIQTQNFLISSAPYWSYQVTSSLANNQGTWVVRRRFRHIVALEDRLRQSCPGAILPPRPDKHATRALEEASTQQSAEFAMQRAREMESYLNSLALHPIAGQAQELRLFLGLQDDIGTAWSEVSNNAFTRLGAMGAGMTMKVAESTSAVSGSGHDWEENAELLGLCSSENLRMGGVVTAVPKMEGTAALMREQGDAAGAVGMELSKVSKISEDMRVCDILSNGLLRHGRRTKRLALELSAAMESFLEQYKTVRYERMAMQDRRAALQRKFKERGRADSRAMYLAQQQRQLQSAGQFGQLNSLEQSAVLSDDFALGAVGEADEIGARLKSEINRIAVQRRTEWNASMKSIARSMKEACSERHAIWQSTLDAFQESHPPSAA